MAAISLNEQMIRDTLTDRLARVTTDDILNRSQVAEFLGVSVSSMAYWARVGRGPAFTRVENRYRFHRDDVLEYAIAAYHQSIV
jgi:Helix-turn-helix domain